MDHTPQEQQRVMKVQEVIMRAIAGRMSWLEAAEVLRWSPRTLRRWKWRYEKHGYDGLFDRRKRRPSPKRVPMETVQKVLRLYQEKYAGFNVRHFHEKLKEEHEVSLSYQWVKSALQAAGLVEKRSKRREHRQMRERRSMAGMMLHCDGSTHGWIPGASWKPDLVVYMDDATNQVYYARLVEEEDTHSMMEGIKNIVEKKGLFCSLYTDRGSHFFTTPKAGGPVDKENLTQIGRALGQLGIEHIPSYCPQGRGRMERLFRTWQGRLPQELRVAGIKDMDGANEYLKKRFVPWHNRSMTVPAKEKSTAFVPLGTVDLEAICCIQEERVVGEDNTVVYGKKRLQINPGGPLSSYAKCRVKVCEHLNGNLSLRYGPRILGWYDSDGCPLSESKKKAA
jgi:transposase